jgi:hypothetical protein
MNRVEVKVKLPEQLQPSLVDGNRITTQSQLFYRLAKKDADFMLEDFVSYTKSQGNTEDMLLVQLWQG